MKKYLALALAALLAPAAALAAPQLDMRVTARWLEEHQSDPGMVLLHVGKAEDYRAAHIAGARLVTLADIAADRNDLTLEMRDAPDLKRRLAALGINPDSTVVVYYGKDQVASSTRVVFTLYAAGLGGRVALLDGGMGEWTRQGLPTTAQVPTSATGHGPKLHYLPVVVNAAYVRAHVRKPGFALIDARAPVFYDGVEASGDMRSMRKGHIPGARNIPYTSIINADMTLKPRAELETLFRDGGVKPGDHLIVYCHVGQQATAILFAARELGIAAVLYDGSFEDWTWNDGLVQAAKEH